jgi:nucleotide-binding universal stress UspA family protein
MKFLMDVGSPAEEIINVAKNEKAALIIMGSRQLKKTEKLAALGSKNSFSIGRMSCDDS